MSYAEKIESLIAERDNLRAQVADLEASPMSEEALDILRSENTTLRAQLDFTRYNLETERVRLAACGVVALSNTPESAVKARQMLPEYRSGSCDDVAKMVDEQMDLRAKLAAAEARADRLAGKLRMIADGRVLSRSFTHAEVVAAYQKHARAALAEVEGKC